MRGPCGAAGLKRVLWLGLPLFKSAIIVDKIILVIPGLLRKLTAIKPIVIEKYLECIHVRRLKVRADANLEECPKSVSQAAGAIRQEQPFELILHIFQENEGALTTVQRQRPVSTMKWQYITRRLMAYSSRLMTWSISVRCCL